MAAPTPTPTTPDQLAWLEHELPGWQADGLVSAEAADRLRARYVAHRRVTIARVVLTLGAAFVGVGLIWLVASNLDQLSPMVRFALMVLIWLGLTGVTEWLTDRSEAGGEGSLLVGALRLLTAASFGAVVFQAAQSLQVPSGEPLLIGVWGLGALAYAYAVRGVAPLVLGIVLTALWFVVDATRGSESTLTVALAATVAGAIGLIVSVLHARRWRPEFATPWREIGIALGLLGLFVAALPGWGGTRQPTAPVLVALGVLAVLAVLALASAGRRERAELGLGLGVLVLALALALWSTPQPSLAKGAVSVVVYLAAASAAAAIGALRGSPRLTLLATLALVVFITTQAFAVFAPILSGALLFLVVGAVLIGTGILAERGRRRIIAEAEEARS